MIFVTAQIDVLIPKIPASNAMRNQLAAQSHKKEHSTQKNPKDMMSNVKSQFLSFTRLIRQSKESWIQTCLLTINIQQKVLSVFRHKDGLHEQRLPLCCRHQDTFYEFRAKQCEVAVSKSKAPAIYTFTTVDGRKPAPPGMYETL